MYGKEQCNAVSGKGLTALQSIVMFLSCTFTTCNAEGQVASEVEEAAIAMIEEKVEEICSGKHYRMRYHALSHTRL